MSSSIFARFGILFFVSFALAVTFQNCAEEAKVSPSILAVDSDGNELTDGSLLSFNLGNGDALAYSNRLDLKSPLEEITFKLKNSAVYETTEIFEINYDSSKPDLPESYCLQSALPHCRHLNTVTCMAIGCPETPPPVKCAYDRRLQKEEVDEVFSLFSELEIIEKPNIPNEVRAGDCPSHPHVLFTKKNGQKTKVALYDSSCVEAGKLYALSDTNGLQSTMNSKFGFVKEAGTNCNRWAVYNWQSTSFVYNEGSGLTTPANAYHYEVSYANGKANLKFKRPGDSQINCAQNISVNEFDAFFPQQGLLYQVLKTDATLADAPASVINYTDEAYGNGRGVTFYLDSGTAQTFTGGPIISAEQATAIKDAVRTLVDMAISRNAAQACN